MGVGGGLPLLHAFVWEACWWVHADALLAACRVSSHLTQVSATCSVLLHVDCP